MAYNPGSLTPASRFRASPYPSETKQFSLVLNGSLKSPMGCEERKHHSEEESWRGQDGADIFPGKARCQQEKGGERRLCQAAKAGRWGHGSGELPGDHVAAAKASGRELRGGFPMGKGAVISRSVPLPDPAGCELQEARTSASPPLRQQRPPGAWTTGGTGPTFAE